MKLPLVFMNEWPTPVVERIRNGLVLSWAAVNPVLVVATVIPAGRLAGGNQCIDAISQRGGRAHNRVGLNRTNTEVIAHAESVVHDAGAEIACWTSQVLVNPVPVLRKSRTHI